MLLVLFAGVFLIGNKQLLFTSTYHLNAQFQNVAGLGSGAEVRVGGIHQGTVKRVNLPNRSDGKVTVVMDLAKGTRNLIKTDSIASIKTEGLLGDKYLEISFGSEEAQAAKDGDTLQSEPPLDISDMIKKTDQILDTTKDAIHSAGEAAANLDSISSKIDQGKGTAGALINDRTIYERANAATAQAEAGATAFRENMEALKHNFLLRGFFKKRGYEDATELTKHEIEELPPGSPSKRFVYDAGQLFGKPDSPRLKHEKPLSEAGKFLEEHEFGAAVVAAYAGMKGDSEKDRVLTETQAHAVRDYLVQNFKFDDTRLKTIGIGKTMRPEESSKLEIDVYSGPEQAGSSKRNGNEKKP